MKQNHSYSRRSFFKALGAAAMASPFITHNLFASPAEHEGEAREFWRVRNGVVGPDADRQL
ncbi:MAG: hypothetical protein WDM80_17750 [Limisphaerales bacterium]